jgi:hypothetical protein
MHLSNLIFFDKFGENYNFQRTRFNQETQTSVSTSTVAGVTPWWYGREYIEPVSVGLYDSRQIFIVEKDSSNYKFPVLSQDERIVFKWETVDIDGNLPFFLYLVKQDITGNSDIDTPYIERVNQVTITHADLANGSTSPLDIKVPLQVNVAFSPHEEKIYERKLIAHKETYVAGALTSSVKILEIDYYGEGTDEDSRYKMWLNNFGISFHKDDAQLLKNYDIKEALPDWKQIDQARKELLVNRDQVFPYVGTYKGLSNFINLFGYKGTLDVKEFWQNSNNSSAALDQFALVNITDFLDDGKIDNMQYVSNGGAILDSSQFKKTAFIALCYQFTKATDNYDDDGLPEVVETTDFTPGEIFYKLDGLAKKVKREILPIHVIVRDIIGEFIFFEKFNIRYWTDDVQTRSVNINIKIKAEVVSPTSTIAVPYIRDIRPIYYSPEADAANPAKVLDGFPKYSFNTGNTGEVSPTPINPYDKDQKYSYLEQVALIEAVEVFYQQVQAEEWKHHGKSYYWSSSEVTEKEQLGCPIILKANLPKYRIMDYDGITFSDLESEGARVRDIITYLNLVDIEWVITKNSPNPYTWSFRGSIYDFNRIVHFLPYTGDYLIQLKIYDQFAGISVDFIRFTVKPTVATTVGFTRTSDKFSYRFIDLTNVTVGDMGGSYMFNPNVTIPSFTQKIGSIDLEQDLFDWAYYSNNFSNNTAPTQAKIKDPLSNEYKSLGDPTLTSTYANGWGIGQNSTKPRMSDLADARIGDLFHTKFYQLSFQSDILQGFTIDTPPAGYKIRLGLHTPYTVPAYVDLADLVNQLNAETHSAISKFRYRAISNQLYASAKESSNTNNFTVKVTQS